MNGGMDHIGIDEIWRGRPDKKCNSAVYSKKNSTFVG